jgi:D-alanine-D-alanine ligase
MPAMQPTSPTREPCDIALLVDEEIGARDAGGRFVVEPGTMEAHVLACLEARHAHVTVVPFDPAITPTGEALRALAPRLVFNLTEWVGGDRRLDAAIVGVLEMMNLPYTGSGPDALQLARDKVLAKSIVAGLGIRVPHHVILNGRVPEGEFPYPAIVKPQFGDGSDGIARSALVTNQRDLTRRLAAIRRRSDEPLLCEQFIEGRDLFVALLGNEPKVMPPLELVVGRKSAGSPRFATYRVKNDAAYRTRWRVRYREPRLDAHVLASIEAASRRIFGSLKLRDYARIDYRLTAGNELYFLEANPNPDLTRHTFGRDRCFAGVSYPELIASIVDAALERAG